MDYVIHCDTTRYIYEVLEGQEYKFLFSDLVVLDVGCNIGTFSLWIYPHAKRIYAVDSEQSNIDLFAKTVRDSNLHGVSLYTERIGKESLYDFMNGHNIPHVDVLKLDIEGDELEVVNHPTFPTDRINTIVGEHHYSGSRVEEFKNRLEALGYTYQEYPNNHFLARKR